MVDAEKRRLADKVIAALNQACDHNDLEIAEHLLRALELILSGYGGDSSVEKRRELSDIVEAFTRTIELKRHSVS
jgi:hypothetical protein